MTNKAFEINRRLVFAMRMIGVGLRGIQTFCGLMDLSSMFSSALYYDIVDHIRVAVNIVTDLVFKKAVKEEVEMNFKKRRTAGLTVSGDGSWAKRGFSSLLGIVSIIGKFSNKILDVIVYCYVYVNLCFGLDSEISGL